MFETQGNGSDTKLRALMVLLTTMLILASMMSVAHAGPKDKQPLLDFETGGTVEGAFSQLDRTSDGINTKIRTRVAPGHAVTIWYVIFNNPGACVGDCDEFDLFVDGAGPPFNAAQIAAARISVVYGGDGMVANPAGRLQLDGALAEGEIGGPGQVAIGLDADGAVVPEAATGAVVTGLEDAATAEVHVVLQDHGPAQLDLALLEQQLTMFMGACNPDCEDVQFAVHK